MTSNKQKLSLDHILQASSSSSSSSTSASTYTTNLNQHKRTNSNQHPHHPTTNKPPFLCNLLQSSQMLMYSTSPLLSHNMGRQQSTHNVPGTSTPSSSAASPETLAQQQTPYSESFLYADQPLWAPSASASVSAAPAMALPRSMPSFGAGFCSSSDLVFLDQSQPIFSYDNIQASVRFFLFFPLLTHLYGVCGQCLSCIVRPPKSHGILHPLPPTTDASATPAPLRP